MGRFVFTMSMQWNNETKPYRISCRRWCRMWRTMRWCISSRFVQWECSETMKQCRVEWAALQKAVAHLTKRIQWDLKRESNAKSCESEWCAGQLQKRFKRWHELHWFTVSFSIRWYCFFCQITNTCLVLIVTLKIREYSNWKLKFIFAVVAVCVFALYAAYLLLYLNCICIVFEWEHRRELE